MSFSLKSRGGLTFLGLILLAQFNFHCSSPKLKGDVQSGKTPQAAKEGEPVKKDPSNAIPAPEPVVPTPIASVPLPSAPLPVKPSQVISIPPPKAAQEEINDCSSCVLRAQQLSKTIGFDASLSKTINFGFYKVKPIFKLCDIYFMKDLGDEVEEHDGYTTSVLNTQVVLYCPCTCSWAENRAF